MRLFNLSLANIGPFKSAEIEFIRDSEDNHLQPPVIIFTGKNGAGKTVVLDAIRRVIMGNDFPKDERNIIRQGPSGSNASITLNFRIAKGLQNEGNNQETYTYTAEAQSGQNAFQIARESSVEGSNSIFITHKNRLSFFQVCFTNFAWADYLRMLEKGQYKSHFSFVLDYWAPKPATNYTAGGVKFPEPRKEELLYQGALSGHVSYTKVLQTIIYFDYWRDSKKEDQRKAGEFMYNTFRKAFEASLEEGGTLDEVDRENLLPFVKIGGQEVSVDKLSAGNQYLFQHFISLLDKMYSVHKLQGTPLETVCNTPGLLLIDEAEAHLHPEWQKTFLTNLQRLFPNLQIILTTHSPFIVSSVKNSRVFVCESQGDHSVITEATDDYTSEPIGQVLLSDAFDSTSPFNSKVTGWLNALEEAVDAGDKAKP